MTYNANYPGSADVLANPTNLTNRDDVGFELHGVIARIQDILEALEAKVGIGSSTPGATAAVLRRTATGASAWGLLATGDVTAGAISQAAVGSMTGGSVYGGVGADIPMSSACTIAATGGLILTIAYATYTHNTPGTLVGSQIALDGAGFTFVLGVTAPPGTGASVPITLAAYSTPAAGSHTYTVKWSNPAGQVTVTAGQIIALELKK